MVPSQKDADWETLISFKMLTMHEKETMKTANISQM